MTAVTPDPGSGLTTTASDQRQNGGFVNRTAYDNVGNVTSVTNGLNQTSSFTYDSLNRVTKVATPNATSGATVDTTYSYSTTRFGWKITETDAGGNTVATQLDGLGRARSINGTAVPKRELRYWTDGALKSTADERGNVTDYAYDVRGRLTSVTAPPPTSGAARSVTSYQYTVDSLLSTVTDPLSRVTTFSYDAGGRNTRVTQPDSDGAGALTAAYTDFTYDSLGNLLTQTDALGHKTSYTLDSSFQTLTSTDPASAVTTFAYDSFGQVTSVVDPLSNSTLYTYNKLGQLVTENKPVSGVNQTRTYSYDGEGNLRSLLDRNGRTTEWTYDNRQRVTSETWKTAGVLNRTLTYGYDTLDRTTSLDDSDPLATDFQFAYDARSQLQAERQVTGLVGTSVVLDREFDGDGNRTWLTTNFGGTLSGTSVAGGVRDSVVNFGYDAMNRLWAVSQSTASQGASNGVNTVAPKSAFFQFDAASQVTDLRRYSATTNSSANLEVHSRYGYDSAGRVTSITHGKTEIAAGEVWNGTSTLPASLGSTNMLAGYFLTYDADNRVTSFASQRDAFKTTYTYNTTDQLTAASSAVITGMTLPFSVPTSESYNLDANGNRKTSGGVSQSASGTQNQLQTDGTYNYTYESEGNVTRRTLIATGAVTDYTWDHRNRLVTVTERTSATGTTTKKTENVYDAFDQRVAKRHDADGNGSWDKYEAFVWADGHEVLRFLDSDGQGTVQSFRVANRYLYADAVDQLISDEQYTGNTGPLVNATTGSATAGNTLWALSDHLGSVRDVVHNSGVVRQHLVFDSFGKRFREVDYDTAGTQIAKTNAAAIDELFGYTGRDWDEDVGLQYNRARWYDPNTGRWLSQDPIGFAAGDANLYRYVRNHAIAYKDPTGHTDELPKREEGHKTGNNPEKHSQAEHARRLQQQNALRRMAQESKNDVVNDAFKHIDKAIEDCEDARKTAERKMLKASSDAKKYADEMARLSTAIDRLKEIELVVENNEIVDVKHLDNLPTQAMQNLTKAGRWQIGRKVFGAIPFVGALTIPLALPENVEAKGFYFGTLQTGLENVPVVEWVMLAGGEKCIPSDKEAAHWYEVISQPVKHVENARGVIRAVDSPGFFDWSDDLLRPLDILTGNWY